jgi:hypothetical protein
MPKPTLNLADQNTQRRMYGTSAQGPAAADSRQPLSLGHLLFKWCRGARCRGAARHEPRQRWQQPAGPVTRARNTQQPATVQHPQHLQSQQVRGGAAAAAAGRTGVGRARGPAPLALRLQPGPAPAASDNHCAAISPPCAHTSDKPRKLTNPRGPARRCRSSSGGPATCSSHAPLLPSRPAVAGSPPVEPTAWSRPRKPRLHAPAGAAPAGSNGALRTARLPAPSK